MGSIFFQTPFNRSLSPTMTPFIYVYFKAKHPRFEQFYLGWGPFWEGFLELQSIQVHSIAIAS